MWSKESWEIVENYHTVAKKHLICSLFPFLLVSPFFSSSAMSQINLKLTRWACNLRNIQTERNWSNSAQGTYLFFTGWVFLHLLQRYSWVSCRDGLIRPVCQMNSKRDGLNSSRNRSNSTNWKSGERIGFLDPGFARDGLDPSRSNLLLFF